MINNVKHKYTTGAAIVVLIYVVLKACGIDLAERLDMSFQEIEEIVGGALMALILAFSRDPKDNSKNKQNEKEN